MVRELRYTHNNQGHKPIQLRVPALVVLTLMLMPALIPMPGRTEAWAGTPRGSQAQQGVHRAGIVVQFGDGSARTYCISFAGDSISGLDLLMSTGLEVKAEHYGAMGAMICKIGPDGCDYPEQPCACQSYGPGGLYWSYHHLKDGRWVRSSVGASTYRVRDGDVDGWAWSSGSPPPLYTFEQICGPALPPAPTSTHTNTPAPTSTSTPVSPSTATATVRPRRPTTTLTPAPPRPIHPPARTSTSTPTFTSVPAPTSTSVPTAASPPATSTPTATHTLALDATPTPTSTRAAAHVSTPTTPATPATPASTGTPAPGAVPPSAGTAADRQALARSVALSIGAATLLGLALWALLRRRGR
jgi:hypothetical protein